MLNINLVPWRAEIRLKRQRTLIIQIIALTISCTLMLLIWRYWLIQKIDRLQAETKILLSPYVSGVQLDEKLNNLLQQEKQMHESFVTANNLKQTQVQIWNLLMELNKDKPANLYLTLLKQTNAGVLLVGKSLALNGITKFMEQLQNQSYWVVNLKNIKGISDEFYEFEITLARM
jgi:type IV pilus assembly protein PilN